MLDGFGIRSRFLIGTDLFDCFNGHFGFEVGAGFLRLLFIVNYQVKNLSSFLDIRKYCNVSDFNRFF